MDNSIHEVEELARNCPKLRQNRGQILAAFEALRQCYLGKKKLLLCGNGGSAADCEHIAGELMKEYRIRRGIPPEFAEELKRHGAGDRMLENIVGALPAISLAGHISFQTAFCNDNDAEYAFAQQLYALGEAGDVLLAITTSGNSKNVLHAATVAKAMGITVIAMTGSSGGTIGPLADVLINVPAEETPRVQELHLPVYHALCGMLEDYFFRKDERNAGKGTTL